MAKGSTGKPASKLTPKENKFVHYYMIYGNAAKAVRKAGYNCENPWDARYIGRDLITKAHIKAKIEKLREGVQEKLDAARVLAIDTARAIIGATISDFMDRNESGMTMKPEGSYDAVDERAIQSYQMRIDNQGASEKITLADKHRAMDFLAKIGAWYRDDTEDGDTGELTISMSGGKKIKIERK